MCKLSKESQRRLGNIMVYIAKRTEKPCKTKVLKILYLMEERWVLTMHTPFTGLPFEVWQHGPVEKDVFIDLSDGPTLLGKYVSMCNGRNGMYMKALKEFDEDEFSDNELKMMEQVIGKYGSKTAPELTVLTHKKGSLWYREAEEHNLLSSFKDSCCNSSNVEMDFSKMLSPCDADFYKECLYDLKAADYYGA